MDDIIREINRTKIQEKLSEINQLHLKLKFMIEMEENGKLTFLDIEIKREDRILSSTWYVKPTDTGLIMNFHALAPKRYKRSVVQSFVHRINRCCSSWENVMASLGKAKKVLDRNQYPPDFYEPIIRDTINIIQAEQQQQQQQQAASPEQTGQQPTTSEGPEHCFLVQYRGAATVLIS